MDTSKTYIKMCDCEEIQGIFNKFEHDCFHDFIWCPIHKSLWHKTKSGCLCENNEPCQVQGIWLPTQDDLQKMVGEKTPVRASILALADFYKSHDCPKEQFDDKDNWILFTWEQLWLAFVMKEKYNKVWDKRWMGK